MILIENKMASIHYWNYHSKEIHEATKMLFPKKQYHLLTEKEERMVKRFAAKIIKSKLRTK